MAVCGGDLILVEYAEEGEEDEGQERGGGDGDGLGDPPDGAPECDSGGGTGGVWEGGGVIEGQGEEKGKDGGEDEDEVLVSGFGGGGIHTGYVSGRRLKREGVVVRFGWWVGMEVRRFGCGWVGFWS